LHRLKTSGRAICGDVSLVVTFALNDTIGEFHSSGALRTVGATGICGDRLGKTFATDGIIALNRPTALDTKTAF
jgi:hypothetical protein